MATAIDRETLNALADRFNELAHSDGSLIAGANTINRKTAYSLVSNMGRTDTPRTFKRLAREAMDALGLPSPGGHGAINGWLAHLFDTTPDATVTGGSPVWTGDAEKPDGQLVCREIRNAAEASAVVIRAAIRQAQPTKAADWRWIDKLRDIADRMEDRTEIGSAYIRKTIDDELLHSVTDGEHRTGPIHKAHTEARRLGNLGLADSCEHILKLLGRIMGAAGRGATQTKSGQGPRELAKALRGETDRLALAVGYTADGESANVPTPTVADHTDAKSSGEASPRLDPQARTVTLPGQTPIALTEPQYRVVSRLIEAKGGWVNGDALREYPKSSERPGYIIKGRDAKGGLPEPILTHIETGGPKGYRWRACMSPCAPAQIHRGDAGRVWKGWRRTQG